MMEVLKTVPVPGVRGAVEILVLAVLFYYAVLFIRGTRGAAVLSGLVIFLVASLVITRIFSLDAVNWLWASSPFFFLSPC